MKRSFARSPYLWAMLGVVAVVTAAWVGRENYQPVMTGSLAPDFAVTAMDGSTVTVQQYRGKVVLLNVWATWCGPCLEEMPEILRFRKDYLGQGVEVILVSGDWDTESQQVEAFLGELGVDFPTYLKAGDDMEFIETMSPEWSGALPASFLFDSGGTLRHMWEGKVTYANLQEMVLPILETSQSQVKKEEIS